MCGRYTLKMTAAEAETFYGFPEIQQKRIEPTLPGFNIAPSQPVLIILDDEGKPAGRRGQAGLGHRALGVRAALVERERGTTDQRSRRDDRGAAHVPWGDQELSTWA